MTRGQEMVNLFLSVFPFVFGIAATEMYFDYRIKNEELSIYSYISRALKNYLIAALIECIVVGIAIDLGVTFIDYEIIESVKILLFCAVFIVFLLFWLPKIIKLSRMYYSKER
ncbi:hypothetical protein ACFLZ4_02230 [Patescibacteria group bacterium]